MSNDPKDLILQPEVDETAALEAQIAASLAQLKALPDLLKKWRRLYIEEVAQLEEQAFIREEDVVRLQNENRSKEELIRVHTETIAMLEEENRGYAQEAARIRKDCGDTATIAREGDARCQQVLLVSKNPDISPQQPPDPRSAYSDPLFCYRGGITNLRTPMPPPPPLLDQETQLVPSRLTYCHTQDQDDNDNGTPRWPMKRTYASPSTSAHSSAFTTSPTRPNRLPATHKRSHPDSPAAEPSIPPAKRAHISAPVPAGPFPVDPLPPKVHIEGMPVTAPSIPGVIYTDDATMKLSNRIQRKCFNCRATDTPTWRHSSLAPGKVLCNGCGIFENTHSHPRPEPSLRKRRRIMKNCAKPQNSAPLSVDHLPSVSVQMPLNTFSPPHRDPET